MKDMTVSKALKWIFIAEILGILAIIPLVGVVLAIIGFVMNLLALYGAGKLQEGYKTAFTLSIVGIVVSVISLFAGSGVFGTIVSIVATLVSLGILYYVINTTNSLLTGNAELVAKGEKVWKLNLICIVASVILSILGLIVPVISAVLAVIVAIVEIVAAIMYLVFLKKSSDALA